MNNNTPKRQVPEFCLSEPNSCSKVQNATTQKTHDVPLHDWINRLLALENAISINRDTNNAWPYNPGAGNPTFTRGHFTRNTNRGRGKGSQPPYSHSSNNQVQPRTLQPPVAAYNTTHYMRPSNNFSSYTGCFSHGNEGRHAHNLPLQSTGRNFNSIIASCSANVVRSAI
jgi:hypothetical protein